MEKRIMTTMTETAERSILESPCTRRLVRDVLSLAEKRDIADAIADVETALDILRARFNRGLCSALGCPESPGARCIRCGETL